MPRSARVPAQALIALALALVFGFAIVQAMEWTFRTRLFPLLVSTPMAVLAVAGIVAGLRGGDRRRANPESAEGDALTLNRATGVAVLWFAGFFVLLWLVGLLVAVPLFTFMYLRLVARESWVVALVGAALTWAFVYVLFDQILHLPLPAGIVNGVLPR